MRRSFSLMPSDSDANAWIAKKLGGRAGDLGQFLGRHLAFSSHHLDFSHDFLMFSSFLSLHSCGCKKHVWSQRGIVVVILVVMNVVIVVIVVVAAIVMVAVVLLAIAVVGVSCDCRSGCWRHCLTCFTAKMPSLLRLCELMCLSMCH